jgi:uncharacterized protein YciI
MNCRCMMLLAVPGIGMSWAAGQEAQPDYDFAPTQMVFLMAETDGTVPGTEQPDTILAAQRVALERLAADATLALAGEISGGGPLRQVLVINTEDRDEALRIARGLPAIRQGLWKCDDLTWYAARALMKKPELPLREQAYFLGILVRGPNAASIAGDEARRIQEGHMANIRRLAGLGKLVLAGPFGGDGNRRGIFIFKVDTLEEAEALTSTDPAIQAGRLRIELHRFVTFEGMLP